MQSVEAARHRKNSYSFQISRLLSRSADRSTLKDHLAVEILPQLQKSDFGPAIRSAGSASINIHGAREIAHLARPGNSYSASPLARYANPAFLAGCLQKSIFATTDLSPSATVIALLHHRHPFAVSDQCERSPRPHPDCVS